MELDKDIVNGIIKTALKEDIGPIDVTTSVAVEKNIKIRADIKTKGEGIICGLSICEAVFEHLDKDIKFKPQVKDGEHAYEDKVVSYLEGRARPILTAERVALNLLSRLSGIATQTQRFVAKCRPYNVKITDTRKTTPGLRYLERYAVRIGGGFNHRMGLWDQVLIKDNHLKAISCQPSAISKILKDVRKKVQKNTKIEIEVERLADFKEALKGLPDIIMLDNMSTDDVKAAVEIRNKQGTKPLLEVSGNITIDNVEDYARLRPDIISVGSITHSVKSLDISLEIYG